MKNGRVNQIEEDLRSVILAAAQKEPQFHQLVGALGEHGKFDINIVVNEMPKEDTDPHLA